MVQVAVGRVRQLERAEANVVERFIVDAVRLVGVLDQLVDRECRVVRLDDGVGHFGRRDDRERVHNSVGVLFPDLGDQQRSHSRAGAAAERVSQLETLKAVAVLGFFADDFEDGVDELGAFGVVSLGPVVAGAGLAEDEVVWSEELAEGGAANRVHRSRLEIDENGARNVFVVSHFVVVHVDAVQLEALKSAAQEKCKRMRVKNTWSPW